MRLDEASSRFVYVLHLLTRGTNELDARLGGAHVCLISLHYPRGALRPLQTRADIYVDSFVLSHNFFCSGRRRGYRTGTGPL
jgi:hypothetical protein